MIHFSSQRICNKTNDLAIATDGKFSNYFIKLYRISILTVLLTLGFWDNMTAHIANQIIYEEDKSLIQIAKDLIDASSEGPKIDDTTVMIIQFGKSNYKCSQAI